MRKKQMYMRKILPSQKVGKTRRLRNFLCQKPRVFACLALAIGCCCGTSLIAAESADPKTWTKDHLSSLVELYRHFHQTPELSEKEKETSARVAKELRDSDEQVLE